MKIFSRIATVVAFIFLVAATIFNFYHGMWIMGLLTVIFMSVLIYGSSTLGVWKRGEDNW